MNLENRENKRRQDASLSRRSFLAASGVAVASLTGLGMAGCSPKTIGEAEASDEFAASEETSPSVKEANRSLETDVLVVGLGASGLLAAYGAASAGAKVVAIDTAESMSGTTNVRTSGAWAVGSDLQKDDPKQFSIKEAMDHLNEETNYQANQKSLRTILAASGRAINALTAAGMKWRREFEVGLFGDPATSGIRTRGIHWYDFKGDERAAVFQKLVDTAGVECLFATTAENILVEEGSVVGVQCSSGKEIVNIMAKAIIMASGGFLSNEEMVAEFFAGGSIVNMGSLNSTGAGIRLSRDAGAQTGLCFSVSGGEYGGAHKKATMPYAFRPDYGTNDAMRLPVFGGVLIDGEGKRFINESFACEHAMFAGETFIREKFYYAVADQSFIDRLASEPVSNFYGDQRMKGMFADIVLSDIESSFDKAIEEGWAYKADTLEDLAAHFGQDAETLVETIAQYNTYCENKQDELFFKKEEQLVALTTPPYYIVESQASGWVSLGGIKTNGSMQALDSEGQPIPSLYVAGADADINTSPLYLTASENGFALASGLAAGEAAAKNL